eukprot:2323487-Ditylum_brightwellii.AAC.1
MNAYPTPHTHYKEAVWIAIGKATLYVFLDTFSGCHQIEMELLSALKTAFAGPFGHKYHYLVMSIGLVNAPSIYIFMNHDFKDDWDHQATLNGVNISENNGYRTIIDDTFCYIEDYDNGFKYLEAILEITK